MYCFWIKAWILFKTYLTVWTVQVVLTLILWSLSAVFFFLFSFFLQGILEPLNRQRLEESEGCDSSTLCVVESKREATPLSSPPISQTSVKPTILLLSEDEDSPSILDEIAPPDTPTFPMDFSKTDSTLSTSVDNDVTSLESKDPGVTISNMTRSDFIPASQPAVVFMSDYTTMEIFQQVTMTAIQGPSIQTVNPEFVPVHPGQDYIRQSCFARNRQSNNSSGACNGAEVLNPEITVLWNAFIQWFTEQLQRQSLWRNPSCGAAFKGKKFIVLFLTEL